MVDSRTRLQWYNTDEDLKKIVAQFDKNGWQLVTTLHSGLPPHRAVFEPKPEPEDE